MWIKKFCIEYILWGIPTIESTFGPLVWTPYPRGSTPLPPPIYFLLTTAPFFPYFFRVPPPKIQIFNAVSHWPGANQESSLYSIPSFTSPETCIQDTTAVLRRRRLIWYGYVQFATSRITSVPHLKARFGNKGVVHVRQLERLTLIVRDHDERQHGNAFSITGPFWVLCEGIQQSPGDSPCKGLIMRGLGVSFVVSLNKLSASRVAGDLKSYGAHVTPL